MRIDIATLETWPGAAVLRVFERMAALARPTVPARRRLAARARETKEAPEWKNPRVFIFTPRLLRDVLLSRAAHLQMSANRRTARLTIETAARDYIGIDRVITKHFDRLNGTHLFFMGYRSA